MWAEPKPKFKPAVWRYAQAKVALDASHNMVPADQTERRNLIMVNPIEGNTYASTRHLVAAYQCVMAGDTARTHRKAHRRARPHFCPLQRTCPALDADPWRRHSPRCSRARDSWTVRRFAWPMASNAFPRRVHHLTHLRRCGAAVMATSRAVPPPSSWRRSAAESWR